MEIRLRSVGGTLRTSLGEMIDNPLAGLGGARTGIIANIANRKKSDGFINKARKDYFAALDKTPNDPKAYDDLQKAYKRPVTLYSDQVVKAGKNLTDDLKDLFKITARAISWMTMESLFQFPSL